MHGENKSDSYGLMRRSLKNKLTNESFLRIIEVSNALAAVIVQKIEDDVGKFGIEGFDGYWSSSLCDSLLRGKPDIEVVDLTDRLASLINVMEISNKPVIYDIDSGGRLEQFGYYIKRLHLAGINTIVIEDKVGAKVNSLIINGGQQQDSIEGFCEKIKYGKNLVNDKDFMLIARIESLISGKGVDDALERAEQYIIAGADAILLHNNRPEIDSIVKFCQMYNLFPNRVPLVLVPTSYSYVYEYDLKELGCNMVIYANQITRSTVPAMMNAAKSILVNKRSLEACDECASINDLLELCENEIVSEHIV